MKVLKFSAMWCSGCLVMRPIWNQIQKEYPELQIKDYDYDMDALEVEKWNIGKVIPVVIFLDDQGNELLRMIGEKSKKQIIEQIEKIK